MIMALNSVWKLVVWTEWSPQVGLMDFLYRVSAIAGTGADHTDFFAVVNALVKVDLPPLMHTLAAYQG